MVAIPAQSLRGVWSQYVALVHVRQENKELRRRLSSLAEENRQFREALLSSERYERVLQMRDRLPQPMLPASLIGTDSSSWFRTVFIDKGESGRPEGDGGREPGGSWGTWWPSPPRGQGAAITDRSSAVDVTVERSAPGDRRGTRGDDCQLKYVVRGRT
jgi:rod shape-determining protein MreC